MARQFVSARKKSFDRQSVRHALILVEILRDFFSSPSFPIQSMATPTSARAMLYPKDIA
jgi:hypothetical protein